MSHPTSRESLTLSHETSASSLQNEITEEQLDKLTTNVEMNEPDPDAKKLRDALLDPRNVSLKKTFEEIVSWTRDVIQGKHVSGGTLENLKNKLDLEATLVVKLNKKKLFAALRKQEELQKLWSRYLIEPIANHLLATRGAVETFQVLKNAYAEAYQQANGNNELQTKIAVAYKKKYQDLTQGALKNEYALLISDKARQTMEGRYSFFSDIVDEDFGKIVYENTIQTSFQQLLGGFVVDAKVFDKRQIFAGRLDTYDSWLKKKLRISTKDQQRMPSSPLSSAQIISYFSTLGIPLVSGYTSTIPQDISTWLKDGGLSDEEISQLKTPTSRAIETQEGQKEVQENIPSTGTSEKETKEEVGTGDPLVREGVHFDPRMPEELRDAEIILHNPASPPNRAPLETSTGVEEFILKTVSLSADAAIATERFPRGQVTIISDARTPTYNFDQDKVVGKKKYIILHMSAGQRTNDMDKGKTSGDYSLYIDKSGNVFQFFPPHFGSGAAGSYAKVNGDPLVNARGIAVEFEGGPLPASVIAPSGQKRDEAEQPTQAQIDAFNKTVLPHLSSLGHANMQIVTSAQVVTGDKVDEKTGLRDDFLGGSVNYDTYARPSAVYTALGVDTSFKREGAPTKTILQEIEYRLTLMDNMGAKQNDKARLYRENELANVKKALGIPITPPSKPETPTKPTTLPSLGLTPINQGTGYGLDQNMLKLTAYKMKNSASGPDAHILKESIIVNPLKKGTFDAVVLISLPITSNPAEGEYRKIMQQFFNKKGIFEQIYAKYGNQKKIKLLFSDSFRESRNEYAIYSFTDKERTAKKITEPIRVVIYTGKNAESKGEKKFTAMDASIVEHIAKFLN